MKTLYLLVVLTQNGAGDINAAFVNTETLAECQQKELLVKGVFESANIQIAESRCIGSGLRFSAFSHAVSSKLPRHFYLIHFARSAVEIRNMPDWGSCMQKQREGVEQGRIYFSSSIQRVIK